MKYLAFFCFTAVVSAASTSQDLNGAKHQLENRLEIFSNTVMNLREANENFLNLPSKFYEDTTNTIFSDLARKRDEYETVKNKLPPVNDVKTCNEIIGSLTATGTAAVRTTAQCVSDQEEADQRSYDMLNTILNGELEKLKNDRTSVKLCESIDCLKLIESNAADRSKSLTTVAQVQQRQAATDSTLNLCVYQKVRDYETKSLRVKNATKECLLLRRRVEAVQNP